MKEKKYVGGKKGNRGKWAGKVNRGGRGTRMREKVGNTKFCGREIKRRRRERRNIDKWEGKVNRGGREGTRKGYEQEEIGGEG